MFLYRTNHNSNKPVFLVLHCLFSVIRATVPKLDLDDAFEQKNDIAKAVEDELEKVSVMLLFLFTC